MTWRYQIVKTLVPSTNDDGSPLLDKDNNPVIHTRYAIHEVYGEAAYTLDTIEAEAFLDEPGNDTDTEEKCVASVIRQLENMLKDARNYPVLDGTK